MSEIQHKVPEIFQSPLQETVYHALDSLHIPYERVDTSEAITMEDCEAIGQKLNMDMVKTLFLCNRQQTSFYLFITKGHKPFRSKEFSHALGVSRVSFAPAEKLKEMLGTRIGAATVLSVLTDTQHAVKVVFDRQVLSEEWYGCSDGTTTGYLKLSTAQLLHQFLPFTGHEFTVIEV